MRSLITLLAVTAPALAQAQQVLIVDDAHLQMQGPGRAAPAVYVVKAAPAILLDASNYEFKLPPQLAGKPINSIQIVAGKDRRYAATWNTQAQKLLLSASTLQPNPGSAPFSGFVADQTVVLAIGNLDGQKFNVVWVGMAKVQ